MMFDDGWYLKKCNFKYHDLIKLHSRSPALGTTCLNNTVVIKNVAY